MDAYEAKVQEIAARLKDGAPAKSPKPRAIKPRPAPQGPGWLIVPAGAIVEVVALSNELVPLSFHGEAVCVGPDCGCGGEPEVMRWFFAGWNPMRNTLVRGWLSCRSLPSLVRGEIVRYQRDDNGEIFAETPGEVFEGDLPAAWNIKADLMGAKRLPWWPGERPAETVVKLLRGNP